MASRQSRSRNGFTLIELLVVVAVIGILASLLLPALAKGRILSNEAHCKSNLRQVFLNLGMYVEDSDGQYPTYEWLPTERRFLWEIAVGRKLASDPAAAAGSAELHCPTGRRGILHESVPGKVFSLSASPTYGYNSFGYVSPASNAESGEPSGLGGRDQSDNGVTRVLPTRESHLRNPADMIALGDGFRVKAAASGQLKLEESYYLGRAPNIGFASAGEWVSAQGREENLDQRRHQGRLNMAFSDGHVVSGKIEKWYFSDEEADIRRWRTDNSAK